LPEAERSDRASSISVNSPTLTQNPQQATKRRRNQNMVTQRDAAV